MSDITVRTIRCGCSGAQPNGYDPEKDTRPPVEFYDLEFVAACRFRQLVVAGGDMPGVHVDGRHVISVTVDDETYEAP